MFKFNCSLFSITKTVEKDLSLKISAVCFHFYYFHEELVPLIPYCFVVFLSSKGKQQLCNWVNSPSHGKTTH